jgi:hypothetical protein
MIAFFGMSHVAYVIAVHVLLLRERLIVPHPVLFLLEIALAIFLYKGYSWARYVIAIYLLQFAWRLLAHPPFMGKSPVWALAWFLVWSLVCFGSAITLFKSQDVRDFMEHQRRKRQRSRLR